MQSEAETIVLDITCGIWFHNQTNANRNGEIHHLLTPTVLLKNGSRIVLALEQTTVVDQMDRNQGV